MELKFVATIIVLIAIVENVTSYVFEPKFSLLSTDKTIKCNCTILHECSAFMYSYDVIYKHHFEKRHRWENFVKKFYCRGNRYNENVCCPDAQMGKKLLEYFEKNYNNNWSGSNIREFLKPKNKPNQIKGGNDKSSATNSYVPKVTNDNGVINDFSWLALLKFETLEGPKILCTGYLIANRVILASATCFDDPSNKLISAQLGNYTADNKSDDCYKLKRSDKDVCVGGNVEIKVKSVYVHEGYDSSHLNHNLAIVELVHKVDRRVRLIYLLPRSSKFFALKWNGKTAEKEQRLAEIFPVGNTGSDCYDNYGLKLSDDLNVCVSSRDENYNCSKAEYVSGPLIVPNEVAPYEPPALYGISIFDTSCKEFSKKKGLYVKVNEYLPWIKKIIRKIYNLAK